MTNIADEWPAMRERIDAHYRPFEGCEVPVPAADWVAIKGWLDSRAGRAASQEPPHAA